ncbi:MFS transporter [Paenibacillus physcomitrellae]|uniref:MFS-type transporter YttB n=1 Tax=Paenibacillus physcomitrellae TaxID=1619311 RepID=A0ABQ1GFS6_9BACL|nr:MFS transporter [Paenibacillus physcomitrellae]GGA42675.1 putative MFS-type transporter YttB [Paenibacillus physcomitrellae]
MRWLQNYPREVKVFLVASLINSAGGSLMWPLITMFIFKELGRSMTDAGLVILVQNIGGIAGQILGGALYHRVGVKRLIVGSLVFNAAGLLMLPYGAANWYVFMGLMLVIGFTNAMSMPAIQAFIGFRFTERRAELFNVVYVANNIGVALGTAISGVLARISYHLSFMANGVTSLVFAVFFLAYLTRVEREQGDLKVGKRRKSTSGHRPLSLLGDFRVYLFMGIGSLFLWLANSIWNNGVSPYTITMGMPEWKYSILWTLNGILIFAAQPLVSWIRRLCAGTPQLQMLASGVFYLLAYICILVFHSYSAMAFAMVLATLGEMLISPAIPAFISEHTGKTAPFYLGLVGGMGFAGRVIGPYAMGVLYDWGGLTPVAWLAVVIAVLTIAGFAVHAAINRDRKALYEIN